MPENTKTVFCTIGGSTNDVCHVSTCRTSYPANWPGSTRQDECHGIDDINKFINDTGVKSVMFSVRANGIPKVSVKVSDTEKLKNSLSKFWKVINK